MSGAVLFAAGDMGRVVVASEKPSAVRFWPEEEDPLAAAERPGSSMLVMGTFRGGLVQLLLQLSARKLSRMCGKQTVVATRSRQPRGKE